MFAERVKLLDLKDIPKLKVPFYDKLSIKKIMGKVKKMPLIAVYLPKAVIEKDAPINREFLFAIMSAKEPDLLNDLIYNAHL